MTLYMSAFAMIVCSVRPISVHTGHMTDLETPKPPVRAADLATSLIRTWVPMAVGGILAAVAARTHFALDPGTSATVGAFAASACAAGYYMLARLLESSRGHQRIDVVLRKVGTFMLGGVIRKPTYLTQEQYDQLLRMAERKTTHPEE